MTLRALRSRAAFWVGRLNLKEWTVNVSWGDGKEVPEAGPVAGSCSWNVEHLTAEVTVTKGSAQVEQTLVHELLHIVLQGHADLSGPYDAHLERAINRITAALTAAVDQ